MGKRKKTNKIDWEAVCAERPDLMIWRLGTGEAAVINFLEQLLRRDRLSEAWELPEVVNYQFEFPLPRGRADLVLFHIDGSISVVEAKDSGVLSKIHTGIGQLSMYAVQLGYSRTHSYIRKILTAPLTSSDPEVLLVCKACEDAGVLFETIGTIGEQQSINDDLVLKILDGGKKEKN